MWSTTGFNSWTPVIPTLNDLSNVSNMKTTLFDTCAKYVNKELSVINIRLKSNKLSLNYTKTYFVPFSNKRKILLIPLILLSVVISLKKM